MPLRRPTRFPAADRQEGLEELAEAVGEGAVSYRFAVAALFRPWRVIGSLRLDEALAPSLAEELRFDPWHCGGEVQPWGPPNLVRRPAYRGSRRGRGVREERTEPADGTGSYAPATTVIAEPVQATQRSALE